MLKRGGGKLTSSGKSGARSAAHTISRNVKDFEGSDDLGIQAMKSSRDSSIYTFKGAKILTRTGVDAVKGGRYVVKKVGSLRKIQISKMKNLRAVDILKSVGKKLVSAPVIIKSVSMFGVSLLGILLVLVPIIGVLSIVPTVALKSDELELTKAYTYITELDVNLQKDILSEMGTSEYDVSGTIHCYINGEPSNTSLMKVYTDADLLLMYLDAKYSDYQFNAVKPEILRLHSLMHKVETHHWTSLGIGHVDIKLTTKTLDELMEQSSFLITPNEAETLSAMREIGAYATLKTLGSPFLDTDWHTGLSSRYGWRIHPITGETDCHEALDIAMPSGTPINAVMPGMVITSAFNSSYGNYVVIKNSNSETTLYAHMSRRQATVGQEVKIGDVIGYVGTTGSSTGNHLHIEYKKDGNSFNPLFFIANDIN